MEVGCGVWGGAAETGHPVRFTYQATSARSARSRARQGVERQAGGGLRLERTAPVPGGEARAARFRSLDVGAGRGEGSRVVRVEEEIGRRTGLCNGATKVISRSDRFRRVTVLPESRSPFERRPGVPAGRFRVRLHPNRRAAGGHARSRGFRRSYGRDAWRAPLGRRRPLDAASRHALRAGSCAGFILVGGLTAAWLRAPPSAHFGSASAQLRSWPGGQGGKGARPAAGSPRSRPSVCTPGLADGRRGSGAPFAPEPPCPRRQT